MSETTTDLAALVASVRDLLIHADSTLSLLRHRGGIRRWGGGIPEQYEVDHLIGELRASYSPKGLIPALLDAAQSAQQRAEAAERRLAELEADDSDIDLVMPFHEPNKVVYSVGKVVSVSERPMLTFPDEYYEPSEAEQDRDTARAENAALREALGEMVTQCIGCRGKGIITAEFPYPNDLSKWRVETRFCASCERARAALLDELERKNNRLPGFVEMTHTPVPHETLTLLIAAARRAERMTEALGYIRDHEGEVCPIFTDCKHVECSSSFAAWMVADTALRDTDEGWRAIRSHYPPRSHARTAHNRVLVVLTARRRTGACHGVGIAKARLWGRS